MEMRLPEKFSFKTNKQKPLRSATQKARKQSDYISEVLENKEQIKNSKTQLRTPSANLTNTWRLTHEFLYFLLLSF